MNVHEFSYLRLVTAGWLVFCFGVWACAQEEPALPAGLSEETVQPAEPALPAGLGEEEKAGEEPSLPTGLEEVTAPESGPAEREEMPAMFDFTGFWEMRGGVRTQEDDHEKDASIGETRLQLKLSKVWETVILKLTADFVYDPVLDHHRIDLDTGQGWLDLREANVTFTPFSFMDVKIGRQILTWGTGDFLFLNDLFPKDWQAFFIGRDDEYLKAPSDAVKMSFFSDLANLSVVFSPCFDADRFIRGRRLSYYNAMMGRRAGRNAVIEADYPNEFFKDHEWAARLFRNVGGYELALYGYWGYWKSPGGMDFLSGRATFPRLAVYGASARGQLGRGIGNVEVAYYDSRQDRGGDDAFVNNSQLRLLVGYQQDVPEIAHDLTVGVQYYLEWMMNYDAYRRTLFPGTTPADEDRHLLTFRVTKLLMNQNLELSFFAFYSPRDSDAYLRPKIKYKVDDHWTAELGGNVFLGRHEHTFFGQFEDNTNVYLALRYSF